MRVLHLIDSGGVYGAEAVLMCLMSKQKENGATPILGSIGTPDVEEKAIEGVAEQEGIRVKRFRMGKGPNVGGALRIVRFVRHERIDVIHCHGYKANILMGLVPKAVRGVPYLVTMHGWTSTRMWSKLRLYEMADVVMARRAGCAVVVCDAMRNDPRIRAARLKVRVVHNGISDLKCQSNAGNGLGSIGVKHDSDKLIIGTVGRLSPEKGFDVLVSAVARVVHGGQAVRLVMIGDGPERDRLEALARERGVAECVHFTGYIPEASRFMRGFDIFVMSSLREGLPLTLLEAMQAGVPVVATRVGGIPEVLGDGRCGILVNPGNEDELARAIIQLYDSWEMRRQLAVAGKDRVRGEFSSENMEQKYRAIYEQVLSTK